MPVADVSCISYLHFYLIYLIAIYCTRSTFNPGKINHTLAIMFVLDLGHLDQLQIIFTSLTCMVYSLQFL